MAHVQVRIGGGKAQLLVDGVDITQHTLADSVSVSVGDAYSRPSTVSLTLLANVLDLDIENADIEATMTEKPRRLCEVDCDE